MAYRPTWATFGVLTLVAMFPIQALAAARPNTVSIKRERKDPARWRMSNGTVDLVVDSAEGRVVFYGFTGGRNLLWINPQPHNPKYQNGSWINYGGDKIWLWPEQVWGWPPPEPKKYEVKIGHDGRTLRMISTPVAKYDVRIVRVIAMARAGTGITFTTRLRSVGKAFAQPLSAWSNTQLHRPLRIVARIPLKGARDAYLKHSAATGDLFTAKKLGHSAVAVKWPPDKATKTFLDADAFAVIYRHRVLIQRQSKMPGSGSWKPNQRSQIYNHPANTTDIPPGSGYTELEWTAPLAGASGLGSNPLRVTWSLVRTRRPMSNAKAAKLLAGAK